MAFIYLCDDAAYMCVITFMTLMQLQLLLLPQLVMPHAIRQIRYIFTANFVPVCLSTDAVLCHHIETHTHTLCYMVYSTLDDGAK